LREAAKEARYLLDRGYPKDSAIRFVSDHHCLPQEQRHVLARVISSSKSARARKAKAVPVQALQGADVAVDGYNVLITAESLLQGYPVYLCDDGFCRDARGLFSAFRPTGQTVRALMEIFDLLVLARPCRAEVLLDRPMSGSGSLASLMRRMMVERGLPGGAETAADVDRQLKVRGSEGGNVCVASSDCHVIDSVVRAVDMPGELAALRGIALRRI